MKPYGANVPTPCWVGDEVTRTNRGAEGIGGRVKFLPLAWVAKATFPGFSAVDYVITICQILATCSRISTN
jgi:hypothetical protein